MLTRLRDVGSSKLWLIDLDTPSDVDAGCLSTDEHLRAARFVFPQDRQRYIAAHVGLRRLLAATLSTDARSLVVDIGASGKPSLRDHPSCRFNLSHSGHLGLVGIDGQHDVGVDIELLRPVDDRLALARQHFDASELVSVEAGGDAAAFLCCWTRKEACVKALGTGLDRDLRLLAVGCETTRRTLQLAVGEAVRSVTVESFVHPAAFVASVALVEPVRTP